MPDGKPVWSGTWVRDRLGIDLRDTTEQTPTEQTRGVHELAGLALRRNPRRVHLLVSPVLAKHVPADPVQVLARAGEVAGLVSEMLPVAPDLVIGYAETATGLGHAVAAALDAPYLHSTRRAPGPGHAPLAFEEEHSHATSHRLLPDDPTILGGTGPLVLIDDEISTGRTVLNTVRTLRAADGGARTHYLVAALLDLRSDEDVAATEQGAANLGVRIDIVALGRGHVLLPPAAVARGAALVATLPAAEDVDRGATRSAVRSTARWPADVAHHGRHGFGDHARFDAALARFAAELEAELEPGPWHVLGTEELMYLPNRLALALAASRPGTTCSSTTRSPIAVVDDPGYAIRSVLTFAAADEDDDAPRFAYNLAGHDRVLLVLDDACTEDRLLAPDGLMTRLKATGAQVVVVVVPAHVPVQTPELPLPLRSPAFGTYPPADVGWLLTDLSAVDLEAEVQEREEAIQAGTGHYAESLPIEYVPTPAYQQLYIEALGLSRRRVALCVGVVAEMVLAARGPGVVLASLARAGTPVGVLLRRWLLEVHALDVPHYTMSIVRGRGIDEVGLRWLGAHHRSESVMFVDGWTGKGMITRELAEAIGPANRRLGTAFSPDLAVLADTGSCVELFGTRDDFLIPSACLNSTVSGLVSRTVLHPDLIGPDDYHGAKYYAGLAAADVSGAFVDAVQEQFSEVRDEVRDEVQRLRATDRTPTWAGRRTVAEIGAQFGVEDENLVKPGVGETTRVLLRRVPWKVLLRAGSAPEVAHVLRLAEERGVEVIEVPGLGYTTVGLIRPRGLA